MAGLEGFPAPQAVSSTPVGDISDESTASSLLPFSLRLCNHLQLTKHPHEVPECGLRTVLEVP